jgi:hypothetical protein
MSKVANPRWFSSETRNSGPWFLTLFTRRDGIINESESADTSKRFKDKGSRSRRFIQSSATLSSKITCMRLWIVAACVAVDQLEAMCAPDTSAQVLNAHDLTT